MHKATHIKAITVITKTVTKLEELGFLIRSKNKKDKRTYDIVPTDKALEVYPYLKEQTEMCFNLMTDKMTKHEKEEFKRLLIIAAESAITLDD